MKQIVSGILFLTVAVFGQSASSDSSSCWDRATSQEAMNACAAQDLEAADRELNRVYREILKRYRSYPRFIRALKKAQRAWIAMRDAQIEMAYPGYREDPQRYGSALPMCVANFKTSMTTRRIEYLKQWLSSKREEGDVCAFWRP